MKTLTLTLSHREREFGGGTDCQTVNNLATCSPQPGAGVYTTTWTETRTYTSTVSPVGPAAVPTATTDCIPQNAGEQSCGWVCCAAWQYCAYKGQCLPLNGVSTAPATQTIVITSNGVVTTQLSFLPPASSSATDVPASSDSRPATAQPPEPAPTTTKSNVSVT